MPNTTIDFSKLDKYSDDFIKIPTICSLFKMTAVETWKRIEFAHKHDEIKAWEVTMTQNIVFNVLYNSLKHNLNGIKIYESKNEKAHGGDIELILNFDKHMFYAPIQSKIIYPQRNFSYPEMKHSNSNGDQIDLLIDYAKDKAKNKVSANGLPLYLLYNFIDTVPANLTIEAELYGCSVVNADDIKREFLKPTNGRMLTGKPGIPKFTDLHPQLAVPWHLLVCNSNIDDFVMNCINIQGLAFIREHKINQILDKNTQIDKNQLLKGFSPQEDIDNSDWIEAKTMKKVIQILDDNNGNNQGVVDPDPNTESFVPKTRVVIDNLNLK